MPTTDAPALKQIVGHLFDCAYSEDVDDERAKMRREVIAELIELARKHAAGHRALKDDAEARGAEDMRVRAECNQTAWMEVARVLRTDART